MQLGTRRLSAALVAIVAMSLVACRATGSGSGEGDSAKAPAKNESAARSTSAPPRADSVVLKTDKSEYKAGEKMTLTLENKSAAAFTFNPCTRVVERQDGANWTALPDEGRMCTMQAYMLDAHGTGSGPAELPAAMAPGRYRVVVRLTVEQPAVGQPAAVNAISDPITIS